MRSRADGARAVLEWTLRGLALALLAWTLADSLAPPRPPAREEVRGSVLGDALERLSFTAPAAGIRLVLDSAPGALARDWLVSLRRAGTPVVWSAPRLEPLAIVAEPAAQPRAPVLVRVAANAGSEIALGDAVGALDSARVSSSGVVVRMPALSGAADATVGIQHARAPVRDSLQLRAVLVLASAGWEGKFVVAALEEEGWSVEARLAVAPGIAVRQGGLGPVDTARYSAVVVLDSVMPRTVAGVLARYARSGGGLVIAGSGSHLAELRPLLPGDLAPSRPRSAAAQRDTVSLGTLPLAPVVHLRADAIALERRDGAVATAVRRVTAGRVALTGYGESWRWRLAGGAEGVRAHREWWSSMVASVAYAPVLPLAAHTIATSPALMEEADAAPMASLIDALGSASAPSAQSGDVSRIWWRGHAPWWLSMPLFVLLLAEWGSRRLRGAR
jgi:hypothetical protein